MNTSSFKIRLPDGYLTRIDQESIDIKKMLLSCLKAQSQIDGIDRQIELSDDFKSIVSCSKDPFTLQMAKCFSYISLMSRLLPMDLVLQSMGSTLEANGLINVPNSRDKAMPALLFYAKITNLDLNGKSLVAEVSADQQDGSPFLCAKSGGPELSGDCLSL